MKFLGIPATHIQYKLTESEERISTLERAMQNLFPTLAATAVKIEAVELCLEDKRVIQKEEVDKKMDELSRNLSINENKRLIK